ncbi:phage terminase large subunit family protein [Oharaeibacter diazotrophicus]|uniref:Phage terminase large subunit GpA-like protein n=1 Tax=Oharaeibacter diazotrophicus TaxID=1920512 RepID=A0A4R6RGI3_9HYPH|nr:terminase gpA endonuclease subunit [Oharaeibacter diazotrophicus]TDP85382.1 phage terminase large subunit GpA-like protein [Oharaeibacter diazotrophicus]BBE74352.1 phage terminase large subunit GpA [Pleomorphomonas sp. SM30]GLS75955.1 terminase [Oharaeibacter diazotrophicus]
MITPSRAAIAVVAGVLAAVIVPPEPVTPSVWARENLVVPDGPLAGDLWDPRQTPYAPAIMDALAPDSPYNEVVVRKSAQTGLTTVMVGWLCSSMLSAPCRMMIVLPTIDALNEFSAEKLTPAITGTKALRDVVAPQTSRSGDGSTATRKKFPGGSLVLANANSASDLSSKTIKYIGCDEVDRWPDELPGQGDPMELVDARFMAFRATADWKKFVISTPTVEGASRIDDAFQRGDQRHWRIRCPGCTEEIALQFEHLKFNREPPYRAYYAAQCCGRPIEAHERAALIRAGRFVADEPGPHRPPSFHVDTLTSLLVTWDDIAAKWWAAQGDEKKLSAFVNLWLGRTYRVRGDAPEWERLMERRVAYARRTIPAGGLVLTGFADVQGAGIWYEIVAWGRDCVSWCVDAGYIDGETDDAAAGAFAELARVIERSYPDAYGRRWTVDAFGVDAGYNQHVVTTFVRGRPDCYACKGQPGWFQPAIGTATPVDINYKGKKTKNGALLWPVGNYSLKSLFYARLRKDGVSAGADVDPPGYCHFGDFLDEVYFRQVTSESVVVKKRGGRTTRVWEEHGPNHLLDCRVGNMALAELPHLGLSRMTEDDWKRLATERGVPEAALDDLFRPRPLAAPSEAEDVAEAAPKQPRGAAVMASVLATLSTLNH